jgi:AraC-like DNA-binding protein
MREAHFPLPVRWNSGLCLLESVHARDFRMPWTSEGFHKIIAPLHGEGHLEVRAGGRNRSHRLTPGTMALVGEGNAHRLRDTAGSPLHLYILCIAKDFPLHLPGSVAGVRFTHDPSRVQPGLISLREIAALQDAGPRAPEEKAAWELRRFGLAAVLCAQLLGAPHNTPEREPTSEKRDRVANFLHRLEREFYLDRTLDDAAKETGMSRRRFTQLVQELSGQSYGDLIRQLRIAHATKLLKEHGRSPIAAAFECGYEDLSTFYRAFKRQIRMTPTQWITHARGLKAPVRTRSGKPVNPPKAQ